MVRPLTATRIPLGGIMVKAGVEECRGQDTYTSYSSSPNLLPASLLGASSAALLASST